MIYKTFRGLQKALKQAGLKSNREYINTLENAKIIPAPDNFLEFHEETTTTPFGNHLARLYTPEEIYKIVGIVMTYEQNNKK